VAQFFCTGWLPCYLTSSLKETLKHRIVLKRDVKLQLTPVGKPGHHAGKYSNTFRRHVLNEVLF